MKEGVFDCAVIHRVDLIQLKQNSDRNFWMLAMEEVWEEAKKVQRHSIVCQFQVYQPKLPVRQLCCLCILVQLLRFPESFQTAQSRTVDL